MKTKKTKIEAENSGVLQKKYSVFLCAVLILIFVPMFFNTACTPRSFEKPKTAVPPADENKLSAFENDLQTMKTAGFEYIFVFRRKDGGTFDGADRKYLRLNAPAETNRFVSTDDDKAFIAGSKYLFPPPSLDALRMRFNIEDYSPPKEAK